jgi:GntR family phosphonate transport system transcriptional regulator
MRRIDESSRTPPWKQIAEVLRKEVTAGRYGPDDRLPSVASLASEWQVNRKTANKALAQLKEEGLIEVEPGVGYFTRGG